MDALDFADTSQLKPSVVLTGTAKEGSAAPPIGLVDIGTSESAYLFRVALPGVCKDQCKFPTFSLFMHGPCACLFAIHLKQVNDF
jgi:hypothetical protein